MEDRRPRGAVGALRAIFHPRSSVLHSPLVAPLQSFPLHGQIHDLEDARRGGVGDLQDVVHLVQPAEAVGDRAEARHDEEKLLRRRWTRVDGP